MVTLVLLVRVALVVTMAMASIVREDDAVDHCAAKFVAIPGMTSNHRFAVVIFCMYTGTMKKVQSFRAEECTSLSQSTGDTSLKMPRN